MTDLYSTDFESGTPGSAMPDWNGALVVRTSSEAAVVSGTQGYGGASDGDAGLYAGIAARADMGVKSAQVAHFNGTATLGSVGHVLRSPSTYGASPGSYFVSVQSTDTGATVTLGVFYAINGVGTTTVGTATVSGFSLSEGDIYHLETTIVGDQIDCYIWLDGDTKPGTPQLSVTDSTITDAGYAGGRVSSPNFAWHLFDDYDITDAAGAAATTYTLEGPSSGTVGVASSNFTVTPDAAVSADVVVTPGDGGDGGTFSPTSVTFTSGTSTAQTFTYTPASAGVKTISTTNDGGLTDPASVSFTASAASGVTIPVFMHHYRQQGIS